MPGSLGIQSISIRATGQAQFCRLFLCLLLTTLPWSAMAENLALDSSLRTAISEHLVHPDGARFIAYRWEREPEIVALYFGANWCGPCHAFVPTLREVRDALRNAGADTEVVYVSLDESEADMRRYMRRQAMPWPAIDHRRLRGLPVIRALGGPAPPNLVLVDSEGRVLATGWDGRHYRGLQPVLEAWMQAAATPASAHAADTFDTQPGTEESPR